MNPRMAAIWSKMSGHLAEVFGEPLIFTLKDGRALVVPAIFRPRAARTEIQGDFEVAVQVPDLSIRRQALLDLGLPDRGLEDAIRGAVFESGGRRYTVEDPLDDETVMLRATPGLIAGSRYQSPYNKP